jgi:hypothetical protein
LNQRLLRLARPAAFLLGIALSLLAIYSYATRILIVLQEPLLVLPDELWTSNQLESALASFGLSGTVYAAYLLFISFIFFLAFFISGWLILLRKNEDWFGLYLAILLLCWAGGFTVFISLPQASQWMDTVYDYIGWIMWPGLFLLLYFFPSGHVVPRWARWFALGWGLFAVWGLISTAFGGLPDEFVYFIPLLIAVLVVGGYSQVYRYRKAGALERQQIKWVVSALVLMAAVFSFVSIFVNFSGLNDPSKSGLAVAFLTTELTAFIGNLVFIGVPISIVLAMLRYRLWDVDLIIRKTLVYGILSAALALLYFGLVTLLQALSASVFGLQSPVIIVLSTLVIAVLFNTLRTRIQDLIDRRFYRRKYDAEKALAHFAEAARNETDIQCLNEALLEVVQETMQPERVSLWIQKPARR